MRVIAYITITGTKEILLEGDTDVFDPVEQGSDTSLRNIGFWLDNWRFFNYRGRTRKGRVFIPWTSALYIEELTEKK